MGANQSNISQYNYQDISNIINQISNQQCINSCTASTNIDFSAVDTTFEGDITNQTVCQINSSSCILKSSLDTTLLNSLSSTQTGSVTELEGIFTLLQSLIGDSTNINQNNYQSIINEVTQTVNNTCRTDPTSTESVNLSFDAGVVEGNININAIASSTKANCVLQNISSVYANNSEANSQSAAISKIDGMTLVLLAIVAVVIIIVLVLGIVFIIKPSSLINLVKTAEGGEEGIEMDDMNPEIMETAL